MLTRMAARQTIKWLLVGALVVVIVAVGIAITGSWSPKVTGALGFVFAAIAVVVAIALAYLGLPSDAALDPIVTENMAADQLDRTVRKQWMEEQTLRNLTQTVPVEVRFRAEREGTLGVNPTDLLRSEEPMKGKPRLMNEGTLTDLHELYLQLPRRRIVVIGDGGTGKTAALISFVIRATSEREEHPTNPVPVLFTAAEWDPNPMKGHSLSDWVVNTVYDQHPYLSSEQYGTKVVERLIERGRIALFLDGLDEMSDEHRADALRAIGVETRFRIVATSRPGEVEAAIAEGGFPGGVEFVRLQHVSAEVGGTWLQQDQPSALRDGWFKVAQVMSQRPTGSLARALDTPLWLSLARSCYRVSNHGGPGLSSPAELLQEDRFATVEQIRSHLLERTLEQELAATRYAEYGRRYLASFARRFEPVGFNWWRIRDMAPRLPVVLAVVVCGVAGVTMVGLMSGDASDGVRCGVTMVPVGIVVGALVVTFAGHGKSGRLRGSMPRQFAATTLGLVYGGGVSVAARLANSNPGPAFDFSSGAIVGVFLGATVGLVALHDGPMLAAKRLPSRRDVQAALIAGAACTASALIGASPWRALAVGITAVAGFAWGVGLTRPADVPGANMGPMQSYRADLRGSTMFGLIGGSAVAIGAAVGVPHADLLEAVAIGIGAGLVVGVAGIVSASQAIALASIGVWLRLTGRRGPIAVVPFLEFARERNLIRVAGTAYQFRHRELREYLIRASNTLGSWRPDHLE
jgi:hypothetical protein